MAENFQKVLSLVDDNTFLFLSFPVCLFKRKFLEAV